MKKSIFPALLLSTLFWACSESAQQPALVDAANFKTPDNDAINL